MGDLESLLLALGLIYLSDCVVWIRRGAIAFRTGTGRAGRILKPGRICGNQHGALHLANPLIPTSTIFTSRLPPLSVSSEFALAYSSDCVDSAGRLPQTGRLVRFDDFRRVEVDGRNVLVNGAPFLTAISTFAARRLAEGLESLRAVPAPARPKKIKDLLKASLDTDEIKRQLDRFRSRTRWLRISSNGLFIFLFFLVAPLIWRFGLGTLEITLLSATFVQSVFIAILFHRAHTLLYPDAPDERFKSSLIMLLAPPTAIRAPDILARPLFERFHPLAIAAVITAPEEFRRLARQILLDFRHPLPGARPTSSPDSEAAAKWFKELHQNTVEEFLRRHDQDPGELTAPPPPSETTNRSYCPRCGEQFVTRSGTCPDCGGLALRSFEENSRNTAP